MQNQTPPSRSSYSYILMNKKFHYLLKIKNKNTKMDCCFSDLNSKTDTSKLESGLFSGGSFRESLPVKSLAKLEREREHQRERERERA